jgi:hypothetical protein
MWSYEYSLLVNSQYLSNNYFWEALKSNTKKSVTWNTHTSNSSTDLWWHCCSDVGLSWLKKQGYAYIWNSWLLSNSALVAPWKQRLWICLGGGGCLLYLLTIPLFTLSNFLYPADTSHCYAYTSDQFMNYELSKATYFIVAKPRKNKHIHKLDRVVSHSPFPHITCHTYVPYFFIIS